MAVTTLATSAAGFLFYFVYLRVKLGLPWITPRHIIFFALFPVVFVVAYLMRGAGLFQRLIVDGAMLVGLVLLFRMIGMLHWLSVFHAPGDIREAPSAAA